MVVGGTSPQSETKYEGQNAVFECLLNGNNGQTIPVQWRILLVDEPPNPISMNSSQYYILPPANSTLVIANVNTSLSGVVVECFVNPEIALDDVNRGAMLTVQS